MRLTCRKREEEYDKITYKVLWELSDLPESGICKIGTVEFFESPMKENGFVRSGETEVWFRDFVHDVHTSSPQLIIDSRYSFP